MQPLKKLPTNNERHKELKYYKGIKQLFNTHEISNRLRKVWDTSMFSDYFQTGFFYLMSFNWASYEFSDGK